MASKAHGKIWMKNNLQNSIEQNRRQRISVKSKRVIKFNFIHLNGRVTKHWPKRIGNNVLKTFLNMVIMLNTVQ